MKRIAFIINVKNFKPSSGHGIFMLGVVETLLNKGHFIDIITDGPIEDNFLEHYNLNIYTPEAKFRQGYTNHNYVFQFDDGFCFEKSINYRFSLTKALSNHIYDLIICNDVESAFVCHQMELYKYIHVASYAHECASINPELKEGVFRECYYTLIDKMMFWPEMTTLIQTEQNKQKLISRLNSSQLNLYVQPYPLTDSNTVYSLEQEGLLYIGRFEDRKNTVEYFRVLKEIKDKYNVELKANVLTRTSHVEKFKKCFAEINHTNYQIKSDVVGEEKSRLIQSSKVAFMPYKNESFGIAVLEALRFMPTVVLNKYDWHYNFSNFSNYISADAAEVSDVIWSAYNKKVDNEVTISEFAEYQKNYEDSLLTLLNNTVKIPTSKTEPRIRLYSTLKSNKGKWMSLENFFETMNEKKVIYLAGDIIPMYIHKEWMKIYHTKNQTYVGIPDDSGNLIHSESNVQKEEVFSNFFE